MPPNATENLLAEVTHIRIEKASTTVEEYNDEEEETTKCDRNELGYGAGDAIFTCFVVAPQVISVWRGTWGIMNVHEDFFPFAQTYIMGIVLHVCFALIRSKLLTRSKGAWGEDGKAGRWIRERVLSRVYTYVFILACIMHWRGGWGLYDTFVVTLLPNEDDPHRPILIAGMTVLFYFCTTALRTSKNILASPYFLVTDGKEPTYLFTTRFQKKSSRGTALYILDCIFSVAVVGSLVALVWRGSWALLDIYLFPGDPVKSCWTSLIAGYSLVVFTFILQVPMRWAAARLQGTARLLLADVYHLVSYVGIVNMWRGVWGLLDLYLFPEATELSNWCSHIISLTLLMLLNCSNSVLVRGVYIDAEESHGECVVFPCRYLRLFLQKERAIKEQKDAEVTDATVATRKMEETSVPLQIPEEKV